MDSYHVYRLASEKQRSYNASTPLRKVLFTARLRHAVKAYMEEERKRERDEASTPYRPKRPSYTREMDFLPVVEEETRYE